MSLLIFALSFWHWGVAVLLVAAGIAALVYLPGKLGGLVAAVCISFAAATTAYQLGFQERGKLDQTAQLQAELAERQREADAAKEVASRSVARANDAESKSNQLQEQVDDYAAKLAKRDVCALDSGDVRGLQSIGGSNPPQPPKRSRDLR